MDESYCLSALRSPFYPLPAPGSLPPLHPSAMHLHLSGVRYPPELSHSSLSALQSERISSLAAERYGRADGWWGGMDGALQGMLTEDQGWCWGAPGMLTGEQGFESAPEDAGRCPGSVWGCSGGKVYVYLGVCQGMMRGIQG